MSTCNVFLDVTKTGNGEPGAGNGEGGTEVWERVVCGNLHKNPIWPMIDVRERSKQTYLTDNVAIFLELYAHEVLEIIRR